MTDFQQWAARHPQAARELDQLLAAVPWADPQPGEKPESWAQQQVRLKVARLGHFAWRNNVGATKAKCKSCGAPQQPVRYGLANDSAKLNKSIKSSDLILGIKRVIRPADVGRTILQLGGYEVKYPGWEYNPADPHEAAQAKWLTLLEANGGYGRFTTGEVDL